MKLLRITPRLVFGILLSITSSLFGLIIQLIVRQFINLKHFSFFDIPQKLLILGGIIILADAIASTFSGYLISGILPIANALTKNGDAKLLDYSLACLNNYLVKNKDEILLPGKYGYKISLGFENGNAGLLMMLNQIQNNLDDFSWLPV